MGKKKLVKKDWVYNSKKIISIPENAIAFVYIIKHISGKYYIGYKQFYSKTTKKLSKKAISEMTDKRKSKKVVTVKESNWKEYTGSCTDVEYKNLWIKEPNLFERTILQLVYTSDFSVKYYEKKHMILLNWESDMCWNSNFEGKFFKRKHNGN